MRMGVTFEDFQLEGNTPDFRERLKREVSEGEDGRGCVTEHGAGDAIWA